MITKAVAKNPEKRTIIEKGMKLSLSYVVLDYLDYHHQLTL